MRETRERNWKRGLGLSLGCLALIVLAAAVCVGCFGDLRVRPVEPGASEGVEAESAAYWMGYAMDPTDLYQRAIKQTVYLHWDERDEDGEVIGGVSGSGIVLSQDGYILTNAHCVSDARAAGEPVQVELYDGRSFEGVIVGADPDTDVALLKIEVTGLSAAYVGSSRYLQPCQPVYVMGHPDEDLKFSITSGIISGLDRHITFSDGTTLDMFQIDAAVNPGNSGGPVYNVQGYVVGMTTAKYATLLTEGIGFAIPMERAVEIAGDLKQYGYVRNRPLMGITVQSAEAEMMGEGSPAGAFVYSVEPGLCGDQAGLQAGDIIIGMDEAPIGSMQDLLEAKRAYHAFDTVTLRVWRDWEELELTLTFGEVTPEHPTGNVVIEPETD